VKRVAEGDPRRWDRALPRTGRFGDLQKQLGLFNPVEGIV
jgi:hypothetical protein